MTTFEILTIVFYAVVVMIGYLICRGISTIIDNQQEIDSNLKKMDAGLDERLENIHNRLNELVDIEQKSDERNDNMFPWMQELMRNYPTAYNPPCYAPDGICTNPQMDCINCPKRGTGGIWSTSININEKGDEE